MLYRGTLASGIEALVKVQGIIFFLTSPRPNDPRLTTDIRCVNFILLLLFNI